MSLVSFKCRAEACFALRVDTGSDRLEVFNGFQKGKTLREGKYAFGLCEYKSATWSEIFDSSFNHTVDKNQGLAKQ